MRTREIYRMYAELCFHKLCDELNIKKVELTCHYNARSDLKYVDGWWIVDGVGLHISHRCLYRRLTVFDIELTLLHELSHQLLYNQRSPKQRIIDAKKWDDIGDKGLKYRQDEELRTWRTTIKKAKLLGYWNPEFKKIMGGLDNSRVALRRWGR